MVGALIDFGGTPAKPSRDAMPAFQGNDSDRRPGGAMRGILFGLAIVMPIYAVAAAVIFLL
jgi:hypothetical protein